MAQIKTKLLNRRIWAACYPCADEIRITLIGNDRDNLAIMRFLQNGKMFEFVAIEYDEMRYLVEQTLKRAPSLIISFWQDLDDVLEPGWDDVYGSPTYRQKAELCSEELKIAKWENFPEKELTDKDQPLMRFRNRDEFRKLTDTELESGKNDDRDKVEIIGWEEIERREDWDWCKVDRSRDS